MDNSLRILVVTQRVDENDSILGFFCGWLNELAKKMDKIYAVTLKAGNAVLAKNIELYSLSKEDGNNRLRKFFKFNFLIKTLLNKRIDVIFVHMCPEYVLLVAPYAKLLRIPIVMWYAHGSVNIKLRIAHFLADQIVTSSKEGFRLKSNKLVITGQGIDIEKFRIQASVNRTKKIILSVGRISPVKGYEILIESANILINQKQIKDLEFRIVGDIPLKSQRGYAGMLRNMIKDYDLENYVQFFGPVPYTQIHNCYQRCSLFVTASTTGSLDKAVLEAMVCGRIVLACNEAFREILSPYSDILTFERKNFRQLADNISYLLNINEELKDKIVKNLRNKVCQNHNLDNWANKIVGIFSDVLQRHRGMDIKNNG